MKHEKIFKRPDGSKVKVIADCYTDSIRDGVVWRFEVEHCLPSKRTWVSPVNKDDYAWRKLSMEDRARFNKAAYLELATVSEVMETMNELHKQITPPQI